MAGLAHRMGEDSADSMLQIVEQATDEPLHQHGSLVGLVAHLLAVALGHDERAAAELSYAATMHDVGRNAVRDEVAGKDGVLSEAEIKEIRRHTGHGALLLERAGFDPEGPVVQAALYHHERYDGTGYPTGIAGEEIPFVARLVAVADVYDSLRAARPYKPALAHETACRILLEGDDRCRPSHFDPQILAAFRDNAEAIRRLWDPAELPSDDGLDG